MYMHHQQQHRQHVVEAVVALAPTAAATAVVASTYTDKQRLVNSINSGGSTTGSNLRYQSQSTVVSVITLRNGRIRTR